MKTLILHIPVIHRGFLDFLKKNSGRVSEVFVIDNDFLNELSEFKPDIASLDTSVAKDLLEKLGFENIAVLTKANLAEIKGKETILLQDEFSRNLAKKYLLGENIEWQSVFLRWDKEKIISVQPVGGVNISNDHFDAGIMKAAKEEAQKAGDWWRQIGAILVKDKKIVLRGWNKDLPSDHTPYQVGEVRDFFKVGERHDLASTIHAEENIIAQAARKGVSLENTALYVTTFPCPVCAKLIACSGIKKLYFAEGGSNFDAQKVLESAGVDIACVPINSV